MSGERTLGGARSRTREGGGLPEVAQLRRATPTRGLFLALSFLLPHRGHHTDPSQGPEQVLEAMDTDTPPSQAAISPSPSRQELSHGHPGASGRDCWACPGQWVQDREGQENLLRGQSGTSSFSGAKSPRHTAIGGQQLDQAAVASRPPGETRPKREGEEHAPAGAAGRGLTPRGTSSHGASQDHCPGGVNRAG